MHMVIMDDTRIEDMVITDDKRVKDMIIMDDTRIEDDAQMEIEDFVCLNKVKMAFWLCEKFHRPIGDNPC